ncbi:MAG: class I SAM-dependent methyltransferase [Melioribacteraceae bacterium]|jgi:ubiquinone/menaquinone biosynthesis C-methylase UbiE|nr:class I SAM-dependent methyltransferase [Melioribacteraceae bacterium]
MTKDPYKIVAKIYGHLMKTISYHEWGKYISDLKESYYSEANSFLEIASGSGKLAFYLHRIFPNLVLLDISKSMLSLIDKDFKRVCADMTSIPMKGKFDFIYSTFDSINYLMTEEALQQYFVEVHRVLSDKGVFTFDASLENNSLKNVRRLNRKGKFQNILYVQKSNYNFEKKTHSNKFKVKLESGEIFEEVHSQKIYNFELYFELAENAGLYVVDCFEAFTFEDASGDSERIQFIMKRIDAKC